MVQQLVWSLPTPQNEFSGSLIPYPEDVVPGQGTIRFSSLKMKTGVVGENNLVLRTELEDVGRWWGMGNQEKGNLPVRFASGSFGNEGYMLHVSDKEVVISASAFQGYFNGLQTLRQLIMKKNHYEITRCLIKDQPVFEVRGVMLDVGRNFVSIDLLNTRGIEKLD